MVSDLFGELLSGLFIELFSKPLNEPFSECKPLAQALTMQALRGLAWLLALQSAGELLARGLKLPFPGPVVGMLLLLLALNWPAVRRDVSVCAEFLLTHLSLLFVPVGVGVVAHLDLVTRYGLQMFAVVLASTLVGLAVTALALRGLSNDVEAAANAHPEPSQPDATKTPHA